MGYESDESIRQEALRQLEEAERLRENERLASLEELARRVIEEANREQGQQ